MKLTYLLTTVDAKAGTEKTIIDQANAMAARGHDVTLASVYRTGEQGFTVSEQVRVDYITDLQKAGPTPSLTIPVEWDNQFSAEADYALKDYLAGLDAEIAVTSTPALTAFVMLFAPRSVRIVQQEHRASMARGITAEPLLRFGVYVDALVSLTERNADWLREQIPLAAERVHVIPNALPDEHRPQSGLEQKVIMGAGRLVRGKGFGDVIRAFARVADERPGWRFRVFGDGPDRDKLMGDARRLGIESRVELCMPTNDILQEWGRASIAVLASRSEGLPLVLLEARGAGVPCIAYDCETGPSEILENGKDGYVVPVGDIQSLADSLALLMDNDALRHEMGERGPESMLRYAPERVAEAWDKLFAEVMSGPASRRENPQTFLAETDERDIEELLAPAAAELEAGSTAVETEPLNLTPGGVRELTRTIMLESLRGTSVPARAVKDGRRKLKWLVREQDKATVLDALRAEADPRLNVRAYAGGTRLDSPGTPWHRQSAPVFDEGVVDRLYAFVDAVVPHTSLHLGYAGGFEIEFVSHGEGDLSELYVPRRRNAELDQLSEANFTETILELPRREEAPAIGEVDYPIDVVYTWVDGADPRWQSRKADALGLDEEPSGSEATGEDEDLAGGAARFRNRDELKYSLRSLAINAPWVRKIFVVTDDQRPDWLVEDERLQVVDHRELFPDPSVLPVFNSHAIETVLHRIPGLSEHFIYMNDDVFILKEHSPANFFDSRGHALFFMSPTKINDLGELAQPHQRAGANNRELIEGRYGVRISQSMLHTPHPHRVSLLQKIEAMFPEEIERTRASKLRGEQDVALLSSLAQYVGYEESMYERGALRVGFVSLGAPDTVVRLRRASRSNMDVLAFGEAQYDPDPARTQAAALSFLRGQFPAPSPWERRVKEPEVVADAGSAGSDSQA